MAFGVVSTLYFPIAASAGASMWGTDVRKLNTSADATADSTTAFNFGTSAAVVRTADPYTSSATDADQTLFGWAIDPTDMASTTDFVRSYAAGNHTLTARLTQSGAGAINVTMTLYIYRVGPSPTRTRTLLGSNSSITSVAALSAPTTATVAVALGAVTFAADETIQYSVELTCTGVAVVGRTGQFRTGTDGGVAVRMDTPPLKILAAMTGSDAGGVGVAAGVLSATGGMSGTSSGTGSALAVMSAVTGIIGSANAAATAAGALGASAGLVGSATGVASTSGSLGAIAGLVGSSASFASTAGFLTAVADMVGSAFGTSTANGVPSSLAGTIGSADGTSDALGILGAILATVGTATVGAACPADWPVNDGLKEIAADVFFHEPPNEGDPVAGATVNLIRDSDGLLIATTVTDGAGHYSFPRDSNDPYTYHVEVRHLAQQGLSEAGCVPV
jgi:hypothetical protein